MPTAANEKTERLVQEVAALVQRFEAARLTDVSRGSAHVREIQRLTTRLDTQLRQITTLFDHLTRLRRSFETGRVAPLPGYAGGDIFAPEGDAQSPPRSQDEWVHLLTRLVSTGFEND